MNKICTSIEQSQKLIELGIDVNTADMCWSLFTIITNGNKDIKQVLLPTSYGEVTKQPAPDFIERNPAWSLTTLLELIPPGNILLRDALSGKYKCINTVDSNLYDNPVDAAFEMVVWLKENGKL